MESDWKKFRKMVPELRERYLAECNPRISAILADSSRNETERFWDAMKEMEKEARVLRKCLDGHSRSKMQFFMLAMLGVGMLKKEDLAEFSDSLQEKISSAFSGD